MKFISIFYFHIWSPRVRRSQTEIIFNHHYTLHIALESKCVSLSTGSLQYIWYFNVRNFNMRVYVCRCGCQCTNLQNIQLRYHKLHFHRNINNRNCDAGTRCSYTIKQIKKINTNILNRYELCTEKEMASLKFHCTEGWHRCSVRGTAHIHD